MTAAAPARDPAVLRVEVRLRFELEVDATRAGDPRRTPPATVLVAWARRYCRRHALVAIGDAQITVGTPGDLFLRDRVLYRFEVRVR